MLEVFPAAGLNNGVDLELFVEQGCTVNGQSGFEALKSPIGSAEWCNMYAKTRVQKYIDAMTVIGDFKNRHVGFYLMKWCCNGGGDKLFGPNNATGALPRRIAVVRFSGAGYILQIDWSPAYRRTVAAGRLS